MNGQKSWTELSRLDLRMMIERANHRGTLFVLFLITGVYLWYYLVSWSDGGTMYNFISGGWGASSNQTGANLEGKPVVRYKWEWESPEARQIRDDERFGEDEFGEVPRRLVPMGISTFMFINVGTYRTDPNRFGVAGIVSKTFYVLRKPVFECSWIPNLPNTSSESDVKVIRGEVINGTTTTYSDEDVYYSGLVEYVAVVVYCTFDSPVGVDGEGGELKMVARHNNWQPFAGSKRVEFVALVEQPGAYNELSDKFDAPFQYDYMYCGPPLHGSISPHRAREWIAYHMKLFGENSHFMFYDAGGMDDVLWKVWEPWAKLGRVSIINVKQQARYISYLSNQFAMANDCLLRSKTLAKWAFFFDIDEYLHLSHGDHLESSFHELMAEMAERGRRATTIELQQRPVSPEHCVRNDADPTLHERQWAMEKLVYRRHVNTPTGKRATHWQDVKSMNQPKYVLGRGIHFARHVEVPPGMEEWETTTHMNFQDCKNCIENKLHYYHYHGTTARAPNEKVCKVFVDPNTTYIGADGATYEFDNSMSFLADSVRKFESLMIGQVNI